MNLDENKAEADASAVFNTIVVFFVIPYGFVSAQTQYLLQGEAQPISPLLPETDDSFFVYTFC